MPTVEADPTLDPIIDAMGEYAKDRGVTMVAAVARIGDDGAVIVRCKGYSLGDERPHARAMLECLDGLTELKAHVEQGPDEGDPGMVH